ncbi:MAG: diguanylate cyclase [Alphaproteobacteria bacterium]|nr:diguanylate cyclase [Alphaproteobacteria bacterium]
MKKTRRPSSRKPRSASRTKPVRRAAVKIVPDFNRLVENSVQGVVIHRNFKPLYANRAFARLFGYKSAKDILELPLLRPLIPEDRWARVEEEYDELIRGKRKSVITRARGIRKGGQEIWLAVTEQLIMWGGTKAVMLTAVDITSQMDAEQSLARSEQHLRAILEILPYPIYVARPDDGRLLFVNRKTCLLFQESAGQLLKARSTDFFADPKEREELRQLLETIPDIREVEVKMKTARGREFMAELAAIKTNYGGRPAIMVALSDISQRKEMEAQLLHHATTDELTGISNRRHFMEEGERELARARRFDRPLSIMMIDLDYFKKVNDRYGHAVGDAALQAAVKRSLESLRQLDIMGRLGGEEFAVIMPETSLEEGQIAAERLRQHIGARPLIALREAIPCTVSIGVAELTERDHSIDDMLNRADRVLYHAKEGGRDRVVVAAS